MQKPFISILLPTHNRCDVLGRAIESVVGQSFKDWELIVLDDASTDATCEVVQSFVDKDPRVCYERNPENFRLVRTLNRGLDLSRGVYIARIDDDDVWVDPQKLEKQINFLKKNKNCVLLGTAFVAVRTNREKAYEFNPPCADGDIRKIFLSYNPFGHSTVIFSKDVALRLGGYDASLSYTEDYDLWLRMGSCGALANLPDNTVRYTLGEGMSSSNRRNHLRYHLRLLREYGDKYPGKYYAFFRLIASHILRILRLR